MPDSQTSFQLQLRAWSAWAPGCQTPEDWRAWAAGGRELGTTGVPEVKFVKPMFRRRLSPVSKMALTVAHECAQQCDLASVPTVFGSRHGETSISFALLQQLSDSAVVSPTKFGLSVHNASSGLFSLANRNQAPTTSLAGMRDTFFASLLESYLILVNQPEVPTVLMICADAALPEAYDGFSDERADPYAVGMVLGRGGPDALTIARGAPGVDEAGRVLPDALRFLGWLMRPSDGGVFRARDGAWTVER